MAKFRSIIFFSGRAGNIVGSKGQNGEYIVKQYQPTVLNPNTQGQQEQRKKLSVIIKALAPIASWAKKVIKGNGRTAWQELIRLNLNEAVTGTFPNYEVGYNLLTVAKGQLALPNSPAGAVDSNILTVSWTDNSGIGNAYSDDSAAILVINPAKRQAIYDLEAAKRPDRTATLSIPNAWNGDSVEAYLVMRGGETATKEWGSRATSDSLYLGTFTV